MIIRFKYFCGSSPREMMTYMYFIQTRLVYLIINTPFIGGVMVFPLNVFENIVFLGQICVSHLSVRIF